MKQVTETYYCDHCGRILRSSHLQLILGIRNGSRSVKTEDKTIDLCDDCWEDIYGYIGRKTEYGKASKQG